MRIRKLYQVFDLKADIVVGHPYVELRDEAAIRTFQGLLADPGLVLGKNPADYDLRCVAIQDELTGQITGSKTIDIIETGLHWLSLQRDERDKETLAHFEKHNPLFTSREHAEIAQPD